MNNLKFSIPLFLFFNVFFVFAQNKDLDNKNSIWIKGNSELIQTETFNHHAIVSKTDKTSYKNILKEKSTLFFVFKESSESETDISVLKYANKNVKITTKGIYKNNDLEYEFSKSPNGQIISYSFNDPKLSLSARNKIILKALKKQKNEGFKFLELICIPKQLSKRDIRQIETYLSIKWGISLKQESTYLSVVGDTIWDPQKNDGFNHRVTGIGKYIMNDLHQLSSGNSEKDGVYIAYDSVNDKNVNTKQGTYVLWGDNNGSKALTQSPEINYEYYKRTWKINPVAKEGYYPTDSTLIKITINRKELELQDPELNAQISLAFYKETVDFESGNINKLEIYKGRMLDSVTMSFDRVKIDKTGYFKLVIIPNIQIEHEITTICNEPASYKFIIDGGVPPYQIDIKDLSNRLSIETLKVDELEFNKEFETPGDYVVHVIDKNGSKISHEIKVEPSKIEVELENEVEIYDGQNYLLQPKVSINQDDLEALKYEWLSNNVILSNSKDFFANEEGDYVFSVTSKDCNCQIPVSVKTLENDLDSNIKLVPNPVQSGDSFKIMFNLEQTKNVRVEIFDINGRIILSETINGVKKLEYKNKLKTAGTYLISISLDNASTKNFKLIVK